VLTSDPVAVAWSENRLDVFARGGDNALWHQWWDGKAWGVFQSLGGALDSSTAVTSWGPGRLDVFARSSKNTLFHDAWEVSRWSGVEDLGGHLK
jgi:hypothetical protein